MQVVLLAAGSAQRLRPLTDNCPKCLLDVGGRTIVERALDALLKSGLEDFVIVTGYREMMIKDLVEERYPKLAVKWITNERYAETNNAYSLMLAQNAVAGEFLLLDSDILFPAGLVQKLLQCPDVPCIALDRHPCGEEEIKILLDANQDIMDIGKEVDASQADGESIGIEIFSDSAKQELFTTLHTRIVCERHENEFYEASFRQMIQNGTKFRAVDTTAFPSMEIDSVEDLVRAREKYKAEPR